MNGLLARPPTTPAVWLQAPPAPTPPMPGTMPGTTPGPTMSAPPRPPRRWPLLAAIASIAAVAGLGAGVLVTMPQRNDLTDQRDAALADVADVEDELDDALRSMDGVRAELVTAENALTARGADLEEVNAQLATTIASLDTITANRDECLAAANAGIDLVDQWENLWDDEYEWLMSEIGSAEEAEIDAHMMEQLGVMEAQHAALHDALVACTDG